MHCKYDYSSEVAHDFKDFRIFYSIFFIFVTYNWEFFHDDWEKKDIIFNWECDQILAIK